ncbi:hypothetical protein [Vibrio sp. 03-59-1]|uniref:hypothetical protein n=1 Tax=Vibrio sp. 03-59-1 TaxID=2607607 RepID=UPI001493B316|nr:hypothetical protein [Vibrio sp. 03-59-1]
MITKYTLDDGIWVQRPPLEGEYFKIEISNSNGEITHTAEATFYEQLPNDSDLVANDGGALDE